jgi:hypothetical protein
LKQTWPKKLSAGIAGGTPEGGEIILGRPDGIPGAVALGETPELGVGSMMMLGPTTRLEALSDPVGLCDCTAGGGVDVTKTRLDDSTGVGASLTEGVETGVEGTGVAEAASVIVWLLGVPDSPSEAGTLDGSGAEVADSIGERPVPVPAEGEMPEGVGTGDSLTPDWLIPDDEGTRVSLGVGIPTLTLAVSEGVGTEPEGVGRPSEGEGKMPEGVGTMSVGEGSMPEGVGTTFEEISDKMLETMLLAGRGTPPVGVGSSDIKLETMLGTTEPGTSGTADAKMLETSEASDDTIGGRIPEGSGAGVGVGAAGSVGPADPEGSTPGSSESTEERIGVKSIGLEGNTVSDVGITAELTMGSTGVGRGAPVPSAVVMPTTMPPDDGWITKEGASD